MFKSIEPCLLFYRKYLHCLAMTSLFSFDTPKFLKRSWISSSSRTINIIQAAQSEPKPIMNNKNKLTSQVFLSIFLVFICFLQIQKIIIEWKYFTIHLVRTIWVYLKISERLYLIVSGPTHQVWKRWAYHFTASLFPGNTSGHNENFENLLTSISRLLQYPSFECGFSP